MDPAGPPVGGPTGSPVDSQGIDQNADQSTDQGVVRVVIVGAGFAGLGMAIRLKRAGHDDFVVLEKGHDLGGTWRENTYPGCTCDIPSHLYSYSFEPNPAWTRTYPHQREIWDYMRHCARKYGIEAHLRYRTEVTALTYDDSRDQWQVSTAGGATVTARAVVLGMGPLHQPALPDIPGLSRFGGTAFHSARWNHDYDLTGKRVGVVGTGASAIQFVPQIARAVSQLHVFQRTPPWVRPKPDRPLSPALQRAYRRVPLLQRLRRATLYWQHEARAVAFLNPRLMRLAQGALRRQIRGRVSDPALAEAVTPTYTMGCKRILLSNDYYPTLNRSNVDLVTQPISQVTTDAVVTADGVRRDVDALVFGTGFDVTGAYAQLNVVGPQGRKLADAWRDGVQGYLGVAVAGFPNLFLLVGPNSGLGHNSIIFMIEAQVRYIMRCLRPLLRGTARRVEVRDDAQEAFNSRIQQRLQRTVWLTGCGSWYLDATGTNRTLWPGFTAEYWLRTIRPRRHSFTQRREP